MILLLLVGCLHGPPTYTYQEVELFACEQGANAGALAWAETTLYIPRANGCLQDAQDWGHKYFEYQAGPPVDSPVNTPWRQAYEWCFMTNFMANEYKACQP